MEESAAMMTLQTEQDSPAKNGRGGIKKSDNISIMNRKTESVEITSQGIKKFLKKFESDELSMA